MATSWRLADKLPAFHQSGMALASKRDRGTSGKSRTQADLHALGSKGCFPAVRSNRELLIMCDYSLHFVASRPARVGDKLVSTRFRTSPTRGFAAIGQADIAVCLLPGTEVAFERDVECDGLFGFFRGRRLQQKLARFRQINLDQPTMHHDALELLRFLIGFQRDSRSCCSCSRRNSSACMRSSAFSSISRSSFWRDSALLR